MTSGNSQFILAPDQVNDWVDVNVRIEAFESARQNNSNVDLREFLPAGPADLRLAVLTELIRVEIEYAWQANISGHLSVADYIRRFPELNDNPGCLEQIAWEENRQRQFAGRVATSSLASATGEEMDPVRSPLSLVAPVALAEDEAPLPTAPPPAPAHDDLPAVGTPFLGFKLLALLGEGAFSRVYLARQGDLANRLVAFKVAKDVFEEPQTLASLQHTNIVPIYSVHRLGSLEAICMPFLGSTTLADLVESLEKAPMLPTGADALLGTMYGTFQSRPQDQPTVARSLSPYPSTRTPAATLTDPSPDPRPIAPARGSASKPKPTTAIDELRQRTYVEAVIWLAAKLAGGLAHAHDRGVLHQDLKPANVLLTDEGEPMLLDFNLASNICVTPVSGQRVGGTLPYMAPEHLEAFQLRRPLHDGRADIFSLGVILYQLLTGRQPFPQRTFTHPENIDEMIADRLVAPPAIRSINRMVSPATEAIVRKCLEPKPENRYESAHQLHEDLQRQFSHRPLRHTPEPSRKERIVKWMSRHPRLSSASSVALLALVGIVLLTGTVVERNRRLYVMEVRQQLDSAQELFARDLSSVRYLLHSPALTTEQLDAGIQLCHSNLVRFVDPTQGFAVRSDFDGMLDDDLREELGEQLYLYIRSSMNRWRLRRETNPNLAAPIVDWLAWNSRTAALFPDTRKPQALRWQRAQLLEWAGRPEEAKEILAKIQHEGTTSPADLFLTASELIGHGKLREAEPLLTRLLEEEPEHFWARLALGHCYAGLGKDREAVACFDIACAVSPQTPWPYFLRGLSRLRLQQNDEANHDLSEALERRPIWSEALIMRAVAAQRLRNWVDADRDLLAALESGASSVRVHCMRSRLYREAGNNEMAAKELEIGLAQPALDELSWVTRGLAVLPNDPEEALRDFEHALKVNPRCRPALQDKAYVLSEVLGRAAEAENVLRQMQVWYPDYLPAQGGRAVLLARKGDREEAVRLANDCLLKSPEPGMIYQLAGVFAATSRNHPSDADRAVELLALAMRHGVADELLEKDPGLDPIRQHPRFLQLVEAHETLDPPESQSPPQPVSPANVTAMDEQP